MTDIIDGFTGLNINDEEFSTSKDLQSADQKRLLDIIDNLRDYGVGSFTDLPQLIVCGIQSAGKSSVMEAISGVPFPRDVSTCTRFATEVVLRRELHTSISVSISPGSSRSLEECRRLKAFRPGSGSYEGFPSLFTKASDIMLTSGPQGKRSFSDDTLKVEVTGPNQPQLTLVDLPGLIASDDKNRQLIEHLVRGYMANPRSVILAVVVSSTDADTQSTLKLAKEYDERGKRTIGILTKPDLLENMPDKERQWQAVTRNETFPFELGWHVLRNIDSGRKNTSREESLSSRDEIESQYFATSNFKPDVARKRDVGIVSLRKRLSKILFQQIQTHLPKLLTEIKSNLDSARSQLEQLGDPRSTEREQRDFLFLLSERFNLLCLDAIGGSYLKDFFQDKEWSNAKLCASVLNAHQHFAKAVSLEGRSWIIVDEGERHESTGRKYTRESKLEDVKQLLRENRGPELPGQMNSAVIGTLFSQYSSPWHKLARDHLEDQHDIVSDFLYAVLTHLAGSETSRRVYGYWINEKLETLYATARDELDKILAVYRQQPMTANPFFLDRAHQLESAHSKASQNNNGGDIEASQSEQLDVEGASARFALETMEAYYDTSVLTFIDNVLTLAIWAPMITKLPDIFSSRAVATMDADTVRDLARESEEVQISRANLERKVAALEKGRRECEPFNIPTRANRPSPSPAPSRPRLQVHRNSPSPPRPNTARAATPAANNVDSTGFEHSNSNPFGPSPNNGTKNAFGNAFGNPQGQIPTPQSTPGNHVPRKGNLFGNINGETSAFNTNGNGQRMFGRSASPDSSEF